MPTSIYSHIPTFVEFLRETKPSSVLDIGLGNGKLGFIAREMLDIVFGGRHRPEDWKIRIDGIEVFPDYIHEHQKAIYDEIHIGDAFEVLPRLLEYDMIFLGDVLEHFEKHRAWQLLDRCMEHTKHHLILNIPLGDAWEQGTMYGNPHERHRSTWRWSDFEPFVWQYKFFGEDPIAYGTFLIRREDYLHYRIEQHLRGPGWPPPNPGELIDTQLIK
ncbi:MAG: hypothetical protein M0036_07605 [Desulfobacteraceae bacterium]|nr:hypothetical protein [Desulfobacteraceae bacterium]